jgi:predicted phage terminase large subunit-like protein
MQRLHEQDVSGLILDRFSKEYEHLCLPMRYEAAVTRKPTSLGFTDPRSVDGALLWPELFPEKTVEKLEAALGEYGTAGQLQQRPAPSGGGIIKVGKIQKWPAGKELPIFDYVLQSWDTAFTEKTTGDPSAMTVWGTARYEGKQIAILLDCFADRMGYPALKKRVIEEWKSCYGESARRSDTILVEQKASGQSILQDLRQAGIPARPYNPGKADKMVRTHAVAPLFDAEIIYIPESAKRKGQFVSWAAPLLKEIEVFPNGAHDDMWDTTTQALIFLKDSGWLTSGVLEEEEDEEFADEVYNKRNPYAV